MIIVHLAGGLGNQMFQYAFGRVNANRLGVELALDLSNQSLQIHNGFELDRVFTIQGKIARKTDMQAVLGWMRHERIRYRVKNSILRKFLLSDYNYKEEPHFHFAPQMLDIPDNSYVCGYWQSEKYFQTSADIIRADFTFSQPLSEKNARLAQQITQVNAVSLHVRRGDYVSNPVAHAIHGTATLDYYQAAIQYIVNSVANPYFFIFSDDMPWVKANLEITFPCQYIEHNQGIDSYNDMRLMSLCQYHIIANSSFSWWGAWLNPRKSKIVVAPKQWFAHQQNISDLLPHDWVVL